MNCPTGKLSTSFQSTRYLFQPRSDALKIRVVSFLRHLYTDDSTKLGTTLTVDYTIKSYECQKKRGENRHFQHKKQGPGSWQHAK